MNLEKRIGRGTTAAHGEAQANAYIIKEYDPEFTAGSILIAEYTTPELVPNMMQSAGVVTQTGGILSHAAIVARELNIPCIVGVDELLANVKQEDYLRLDTAHGEIYRRNDSQTR